VRQEKRRITAKTRIEKGRSSRNERKQRRYVLDVENPETQRRIAEIRGREKDLEETTLVEGHTDMGVSYSRTNVAEAASETEGRPARQRLVTARQTGPMP